MITNFVNKDGKRVVEGNYGLSMEPKIEFNTLTMVGGSLLNRDDTGHQKTLAVGGVPRMRISSQCIKRPIRKEICGDADGTRRATYLIRLGLEDLNLTEEQLEIVDEFILYFLSDTTDESEGKKTKKTKKSYLLSKEEQNAIILFVKNNLDDILSTEKVEKQVDKKKKKDEEYTPEYVYDFAKSVGSKTDAFKIALILDTPMSSEVALCGRMETSGIVHETDSAVSISQFISVDPFQNEYDFFVANEDVKVFGVEEKRWGTNQESAIPGECDVNSNTLYGYSCLNIYTLFQNLSVGRDISNPEVQQYVKEEAARIACEWAKAFVQIRPSAKQAASATYTRPDLVYVTIGDKTPNWSYENVYNKPVYGDYNKGVMEQATDRLADYLEEDMCNFSKYIGRYWVETGRKDRKFSEELGITTDMKYKDIVAKIREVVMSVNFERKE